MARDKIQSFLGYLGKDRNVPEFGCGLGKDLFSIADPIMVSYGIDINPFYMRIANRLAKKYNFSYLHFVAYNGNVFPPLPKFDLISTKGVFERLDKAIVSVYIRRLKKYLKNDGIMIFYFLTTRTKGTEFT
ncbi:MAG: class I SAM-dependent methyltransferase [Thermoplasmata archaeon]